MIIDSRRYELKKGLIELYDQFMQRVLQFMQKPFTKRKVVMQFCSLTSST